MGGGLRENANEFNKSSCIYPICNNFSGLEEKLSRSMSMLQGTHQNSFYKQRNIIIIIIDLFRTQR